MYFNELMFEKTTLIKFELYRSLFIQPKGIYTIHFFAEQFDWNYQQAVAFFSDLDHDLSEMDKSNKALLIGNGKVNLENLTIGVDEYRTFLLQQSVPFLLMQSILRNEQFTIEEFCDTYNVSRSTVSRKTANLSKFLKTYKIRISYKPIRILGDEYLIRLILFYFYWLGVRASSWPFEIPLEQVHEYQKKLPQIFALSKSYLGYKELEYIVAIVCTRISHKNFAAPSKFANILFKNKEREENVLEALKIFGPMDEKDALAEAHFILFMSHFIPNYDERDIENINLVIQEFVLGLENHAITHMNHRFLEFVRKEIFANPINRATEKTLIANLTNIALTYYILGSSVPDFEILAAPLYHQNEAKEILKYHVNNFFEKLFTSPTYSRFRPSKENIIRRYTNLLLPIYVKQEKQDKIHVAIAIESNQILFQRLNGFLSTLTFIDCVDFNPNNVEHYDIVVTSSTSLSQDFPDTHIFYWDVEYGQKELIYLYQYLQTQYLGTTN